MSADITPRSNIGKTEIENASATAADLLRAQRAVLLARYARGASLRDCQIPPAVFAIVRDLEIQIAWAGAPGEPVQHVRRQAPVIKPCGPDGANAVEAVPLRQR